MQVKIFTGNDWQVEEQINDFLSKGRMAQAGAISEVEILSLTQSESFIEGEWSLTIAILYRYRQL